MFLLFPAVILTGLSYASSHTFFRYFSLCLCFLYKCELSFVNEGTSVTFVVSGNSFVSWSPCHSPRQVDQAVGAWSLPCILRQIGGLWWSPVLLWNSQGKFAFFVLTRQNKTFWIWNPVDWASEFEQRCCKAALHVSFDYWYSECLWVSLQEIMIRTGNSKGNNMKIHQNNSFIGLVRRLPVLVFSIRHEEFNPRVEK